MKQSFIKRNSAIFGDLEEQLQIFEKDMEDKYSN